MIGKRMPRKKNGGITIETIVLSGYYGFDNGGDEAILYSIITELRRLKPGLKIIVLSNNPVKTEFTYGVQAANRWHLPSVVSVIREASLFISGGGSLLQDVTGTKSIIYYLGVVGIAQAMGVPTFFYSQGIGPINGLMGKKLIPLVANRVDRITVRDSKSARLLESLGVTKPEVVITADPVLGIDPGEVNLSRGEKLVGSLGAGARGRIGLTLRDWPGMEELLPSLAKWCNDCAAQGWQIVILPLHLPGDKVLGERLLNIMAQERNFSQEKCVILEGGYLTEEYLGIIGSLDFLISMRLHGLIMAAVMGVPMAG
ncbi:MAG: polysaccharide pyruvyl transferase CsaB, partial [Clostridia bacterium]|nr:polysaccharide pyruvyl transferase CsaB [Clostridia bacterium]